MRVRTLIVVVRSLLPFVIGGVLVACGGGAELSTVDSVGVSGASRAALERVEVPGLPTIAASELRAAERDLAREVAAAIGEPLTVSADVALADYVEFSRTRLRSWLEARSALVARVAATSSGARASVAGALSGALACSMLDVLEGLPPPRELRDDAELAQAFRIAFREPAERLGRAVLTVLALCMDVADAPWSGAPCGALRERILRTMNRAATAPGDAAGVAESESLPLPEGVYTDFASYPMLELGDWHSPCDYPDVGAPPTIIPTATRFAVRTPTGIVAALGDGAREALRLAVEARVAAQTRWTPLPTVALLEAERAEAGALAQSDRCQQERRAERELARANGSTVIASVHTRCFQPGSPCSLSIELQQVDATGERVAARLPSFGDEDVRGTTFDAWRDAAERLHDQRVAMILGILRAPRLVGVQLDVTSPHVEVATLARALARAATAVADCGSGLMAASLDLAVAFSADGRVTACEAGVGGQPVTLTRCACEALTPVAIPSASEAQRLAAVHFALGAAPRSLASALDVRIPERAEDGALSSVRARDEFARCLGQPSAQVAYDVTTGPHPTVRVRGGSGPVPDAQCLLSALRALPASCASLPSRLTICARPIVVRPR